jgi:hypothetical protein
VKRIGLVILAGLTLAGCEHPLTLDEAQAQCEKKGGLLTVIYVQEVSLSGAGPESAEAGKCMSSHAFDKPADKPAPDAQKPAPQ